MEKRYKALVVIFLLFIFAGLAGFYQSYFSTFPDFTKLNVLIHIHATAFLLWFVLIVWQPILIKQKKFEMHRNVGRASYFLVAFIFVSVFLVSAVWIRQELPDTSMSKEEFYAERFPGIFQGVLFSVYYVIAMLNKRNTRIHVAFIIAATLVVFTLSVGRLVLRFFPVNTGMSIVGLVEFLLLIGILIYEKIKLKRKVFASPYFLIICLLTTEFLIIITVPGTNAWQLAMENFANFVM